MRGGHRNKCGTLRQAQLAVPCSSLAAASCCRPRKGALLWPAAVKHYDSPQLVARLALGKHLEQ
jgi:hypothetical protein